MHIASNSLDANGTLYSSIFIADDTLCTQNNHYNTNDIFQDRKKKKKTKREEGKKERKRGKCKGKIANLVFVPSSNQNTLSG